MDEAYQFSSRVEGNQLIVRWEIAEGYYLYKQRMSIAANESAVEIGQPQWSKQGKDKHDEYFGQVKAFYHEVEASIPVVNTLNGEATITIGYQGCAEAGLCYPPQKRQALYVGQNISVDPAVSRHSGNSGTSGNGGVLNNEASSNLAIIGGNNNQDDVKLSISSAKISSEPLLADAGLGLAIIFAFAGGLILNLMPCVFPVLSLKALKLAQSQSRNPQENRIEALAYTAGVITLFTGIALVLILLRSTGEQIGWGFQLQSPWFVGLMVYILFLLGLSLAGWLEPGARLMGLGNNLTQTGGKRGAFFTGALAVIVASPCTAPFMGSALGYAITLQPLQAILIFVALGLGMAVPFLLLGFLPALGRLLPKPGPWMETFKQVLAFPMFLSALWLLWVLGRQTSVEGMTMVLAGLIALVFSAWLYKHALGSRSISRNLAYGSALASAVFSVWILGSQALSESPEASSEGQVAYLNFDSSHLETLLESGKPVFVNVTADWCVSCLVNEKTVLGTDPVAGLLASNDIIYMKGDWTNDDPEITNYLNSFGRNGVPLYVVYQPGQNPVLLSQILSTNEVMSALKPDASDSKITMN